MEGILIMSVVYEWGPLVICLTYTVVATILGYSAKGKLDMNKMDNWSRSGNTMGLIVMIFLTGAGNVSAYTFLGAPGWGFSKGVAVFYVVVYLSFMAYTSYFMGPRVTKLAQEQNIGTQAEAIGVRFESQFLRLLCGIVGAAAVCGNCLIQIIGCGNILNTMSHGVIPLWLGQGLILAAITFYVYNSGLRAIGWTNILQGVMMFCLSILCCLFVIFSVQGNFNFGEAFNVLVANQPEWLTLPGADGSMPEVFWTTSIIISIFTFWPQYWTFAAGAKNEDACRKQYTYLPIFYFVMVPMIVVGLLCAVHFSDYTGNPDNVALEFCIENLPWWLTGLLGAGILAASQSSAEPMLHTPAYLITHDVVGNLAKWDDAKQGKWQRKIFLVITWLIAYPLALSYPADLVTILLVCYGFIAQLFPCMLGVICWPRGTKYGAIAGLIAGVLCVIICNFVWANPLGIHAGIWGFMFNIPAFIIVSLLTKPASEETLKRFFDKDILDRFYCRDRTAGKVEAIN